jgi:hypothetical protein
MHKLYNLQLQICPQQIPKRSYRLCCRSVVGCLLTSLSLCQSPLPLPYLDFLNKSLIINIYSIISITICSNFHSPCTFFLSKPRPPVAFAYIGKPVSVYFLLSQFLKQEYVSHHEKARKNMKNTLTKSPFQLKLGHVA